MEKFVKERPYLFWSTANYRGLSAAVILENTLNYGDFSDAQELFKILGFNRAAAIFRKQLKNKRHNYQAPVANYFQLYFNKYAR
ncbi:MAG: hypothetical protein WC523_07075 [Patescibacteria group bacterium]|jgi:hypothetical protein